MNKIYRVIFNKARGIFMAVSELTNSHSKEKSSVEGVSATGTVRKSLFKLSPIFFSSMLAAWVLAVPEVAWADHDTVDVQDGRIRTTNTDCGKTGMVQMNLYTTNNDTRCGDIANYAVAIGWESAARLADSIAIGREAIVRYGTTSNEAWTRSVVVGPGSVADGQQATVLGSTSGARSQATAIGNDVYAVGGSSIAIGNDDIVNKKYQDKLPKTTIDSIYAGIWGGSGDPNVSGSALLEYGGANISKDNTFYRKYIDKDGADQRIFSPTLAAKLGAIAIGSRTVAGGEVSTAVGSLSFALADRSTAIGLRAFVAPSYSGVPKGAEGATAVGENTRVYSPESVAIGNQAEATDKGTVSYGYRSKAVGTGSLAMGYATVAGAAINKDTYDSLKISTSDAHNIALVNPDGSLNNTNRTTFKKAVDEIIKKVDTGFKDNAMFVQKGTDGQAPKADGSNAFFETTVIDENGNPKTQRVYAIQLADGDLDNPGPDWAENSMAVGRYAFALRNNTVAFGYATIADAASGIAIGSYSHVTDQAPSSVALGVSAYANGRNSLVMGYSATTHANNSLVLGMGATAGGSFTSTDTPSTRTRTLANGTQETLQFKGQNIKFLKVNGVDYQVVSSANAESNNFDQQYPTIIDQGNGQYQYLARNSSALGMLAKATAFNSTALGNFSNANMNNSMALGYRSQTDYSVEDLNKPGWVATGAIAIPTSAATGVISVGAINQERRITNVASGYRDSDAVNVAQLRTLDERISNIAGSENSSGLFQYMSIENKKSDGKAGALAKVVNKERNYSEYITLRKQYLGFVARNKLNGETIDSGALGKIKDRIDALAKDTNFSTLSAELKKVEDELTGITTPTTDKTRYDAIVDELTSGFNADSKATVLTAEEQKTKKQVNASNFKNDGAVGKDSLAVGWRATTGTRSTKIENGETVEYYDETQAKGDHAIAAGFEATATGQNAIAMGSSALVNNVNTLTQATGNNSLAIGTAAQAAGHNSIAQGNGAKATNWHSIALGTGATAGDSDHGNTIAIGPDSKATGTKSIAIGSNVNQNATTVGNFSVVIGSNDNSGAIAVGNYSVVIGPNNTNTADSTVGEKAVVIGSGNKVAGAQAIAIGTGHTVSGANSGAFGDPNNVSGAGSYAFGNNNTVASNNTFVLGNNVVTNASGSQNISGAVYLGDSAAQVTNERSRLFTLNGTTVTPTAYGADKNSAVTINGTQFYGFAGNSPTSFVSIGSNTNARLLQGVAAGTISANSTDAINGSQLYSVISTLQSSISTATQNAGVNWFNVNSERDTDAGDTTRDNNNKTATVTGALGTDSIAIGKKATAGAKADTGTGVTEKTRAIAIGTDASASGQSSISLGDSVKTTGDNTIALGKDINVEVRGLIGTSAETAGTDAILIGRKAGSSLSDQNPTAKVGTQSVIIGTQAYAQGDSAVAVGANAGASGNSAVGIGVGTSASGRFSVALGQGASSPGMRSVALGAETNTILANAAAVGRGATATGVHNGDFLIAGATGTAAGAATSANAIFDNDALVTAVTEAQKAVKEAQLAYTNAPTEEKEAALETLKAKQEDLASKQQALDLTAGRNTKTVSVFSVGSDTVKRQIQNVAAGVVSADSTDAINGSQLFYTAQSLQAKLDAAAVNWVNVNSSPEDDATADNYDKTRTGAKGTNSVAIGKNAYTGIMNDAHKNVASLQGTSAVAIGLGAKSYGNETVSLGTGAVTQAKNSIAIGSNAKAGSLMTDPTIEPTGYDSIAIGNSAVSQNIGTIAIGSGAQANYQYGIAIGEGAVAANSSVVIGKDAKISDSVGSAWVDSIVLGSSSLGTRVAGATNNVQDKGNVFEIDGASGEAVAVYGRNDGYIVNFMSIGNERTKRQIQNVGAGRISATSTDAINGSQLYYTNEYLLKLAEKVGNGPINGVDGATGADGKSVAGTPGTPGAEGSHGIPGKDGTDGLQGPAGRDGQSDTTLVNKVQSLRDGVSGTVVYTYNNPEDPTDASNGTRVLAENGEYYPASSVSGYAKANNGLWYEASKVNADGTLKDPADATGKTLADLNQNTALDKAKVALSAVNPDGKTTTPVTLGNIASVLGIPAATPVTDATTAAGYVGKPAQGDVAATGLFALSGANLNRAVTAADLQALAVAGVNFGARSGNVVNIPLGGQFNIYGDGAGTPTNDNKPTDKYVTTVTTTDGVNVKLADTLTTKLDNLPEDVATDLAGKANVSLNNITVDGNKVISGLVDVVEDATADSDALTITSDTDNTSGKKTVTVKLDNEKIKEIAGTSDLASTYAKVDASNITTDTNKGKWRDMLGGLTFTGDAGAGVTKKLNETLPVTGGATDNLSENNIGVTANDDGLLIQLAKTLTGLTSAEFGTSTAGTTINADGVTIKGGTKDVVLSKTGLNNGDNKISGVAKGTEGTDAVNKSQMETAIDTKTNTIITDLTNKGFDVAGNGGTKQTIKLGETLNVKGKVHAAAGTTPQKQYVTTEAGADGITIDLTEDMRSKLDGMPTDGAASKKQTLKFTAKDTTNKETAEQSFDKDGGLVFKVTGDSSITTEAAGDTITVKVAQGGIGTDHLADNAVTGAKIADGTITSGKLESTLKKNIDDATGLLDNKIQLGGNASSATDKVALTEDLIKFDITGDGADITTTATGKAVQIALNKATSITADSTSADAGKVVTSSLVFNAIKGAKTEVSAAASASADDPNLITVTPTVGDGITKNTYSVALKKSTLTGALDGVYTKLDGSNLDTTHGFNKNTWLTALGLDGVPTSDAGLRFKADKGSEATVKLSNLLTITDDSTNAAEKYIVTTTGGSNGAGTLGIRLSDTAKAKLDKIDVTAGVAKGNQTIELTDNTSTGTTGTQRLDQAGGLKFKIAGAEGIDTVASAGTITVKIKDGGVTTAKLAEGAVTKAKLASNSVDSSKIENGTIVKDDLNTEFAGNIQKAIDLIDNTIQLGSDSGDTATQRLDASSGIKFNIKSQNSTSTGGASYVDGLITSASGADIRLALQKASSIADSQSADKNKVVTSSQVYDALIAAKPVVRAATAADSTNESWAFTDNTDNLIQVKKFAGTGITKDTWSLALTKEMLYDTLDSRYIQSNGGNAAGSITFIDNKVGTKPVDRTMVVGNEIVPVYRYLGNDNSANDKYIGHLYYFKDGSYYRIADGSVATDQETMHFSRVVDQAEDYSDKQYVSKAIDLGKGLKFQGDGYITVEYTSPDYETGTAVGSVPVLTIKTTSEVKKALEWLAEGRLETMGSLKYKANASAAGTTTLLQGLDFRGETDVDGSANNRNINVSTPDSVTYPGVVNFTLAPELSDMKSIGSGSRLASDDTAEARLSFYNKTGDNVAPTELLKNEKGETEVQPVIAANNVKLTGLKNGQIAKGSTDAVTGDQIAKIVGTNDGDHNSITGRLANLENGINGTVVYTTEEGDRLVRVKAQDGSYKLYKVDGDTKDKHYYAATNKWYSDAEWDSANNKPQDGASAGGTAGTTVSADEAILSLVGKDGTTSPIKLGNLASALGLDTKPTATALSSIDDAQTAIGTFDAASPDTATGLYALKGADLSRAATMADLQALALAGIDFVGNQDADASSKANRIRASLGALVKIEGASGLTYTTETKPTTNADATKAYAVDYSASNLITYKDGDALRIAMKTKPSFEALTLQGSQAGDLPVTFTPGKDAEGNPTVTLASGEDANPVQLKGIAAGKDGKDAVNMDQLAAVKKAVGMDGAAGSNGNTGPAGKDGLNGETIGNQVQALRDGFAGTVVYTDAAGNRLVTADGNNYYAASAFDGKTKANNGKWYDAADVKADGSLVDNPSSNGKTFAEVVDGQTATTQDKVILSAVAPDGSTNGTPNPVKLSNLAGVLGKMTGSTPADKVTSAQAQVAKLVEGKDPTSSESNSTLDTKRAATAGDIQMLARAGLTFEGNNSDVKVNRALGETLMIKAENTATTMASGNSAAGNLFVEGADNTGSLTIKLAKDLVNVTSIGKGASSDTKSARISFTDAASGTAKPQISMNNAQVKAVAAGTEDTDAVNVTQLKSLLSIMGAPNSTDTNKYTMKADGTIQAPAISGTTGGIGGTGKATIDEAIDSLRQQATNAAEGKFVFVTDSGVDKKIEKALGAQVDIVSGNSGTNFKGDNVQVSNEGGKITVSLKQITADDLADATKDGLVTAGVLRAAKLNYKAGTETDAKATTLDTGLTFKSGNTNITVKSEANGVVTYSLADALTNMKSISGNGVTMTFTAGSGAGSDAVPASIALGGAKITGLAAGKADQDAVNVKQLTDAINTAKTEMGDSLADTGSLKYYANGQKSGNALKSVALKDGLNFSNGTNTTAEVGDNGVVKYNLNATLTGITSISGPKVEGKPDAVTMTLGDGTLTFSGGKNGAQLKGVLKGADDTDAVNVSQLKAVAEAIGGKVGSDGTVTGPTYNVVIKGSGQTDKPADIGDAVDDLITAVNKGLTFGDGAKTVTKQLGDTLHITKAITTNTMTSKGYVGDNLLTELKDGNIYIGFKKAPTFTELALQGTNTPTVKFTPGGTAAAPTLKLSADSKDVQLKGVAAGKDSTDAVNLAQLNAVRDSIGLPKDGKDGINGVDGASGVDGKPVIGQPGVPGKDGENVAGLTGPAGKDGLNGTSLTNKVQSLRDGVAGTVVYTDTAGNRLVAENGKYYDAGLVSDKAKAADGLWYAKDKVNPDGSVKEDAVNTGITLKDLATEKNSKAKDAKDVMLSAVDADGKTQTPTTLANVRSALGLTGKADNSAGDEASLKAPAAINAEAARKAIAGEDGQSGLLSKSGAELNKVTTLGDLQAVAQAGLDFMGNDGSAVHRALGTTFKILGAGLTYTTDAKPATDADATKAYKADYAADNLITHADGTDTVRIEMKKLPHFEGIVINGKDGDDGQDGKGKDGFIGVDKDGNIVVINGVDGKNGKNGENGLDGKDGSRVITEKDINGTGNVDVKLSYKAGTEDAKTTTLKEGLTFNGDDNIKTSTGDNGVVNVKLSDKLTGIDSIGGKAGEGSLDFGSRDKTGPDGKPVKDNAGNIVKEKTIDAGGAVITNIGKPTKGTDAANKDYVDQAVTNISNNALKPIKVSADTGTFEINTSNSTLAVKGDSKNISVTAKEDNSLTVELNKNIELDSVKTGDVSVSKDGINAGGKTVTNVGEGTIGAGSKDAVTGGQIADIIGKDAIKDGKVTDIGGTGASNLNDAIKTIYNTVAHPVDVKAGANIVVDKSVDKGITTYTVSTSSKLAGESVTVGKDGTNTVTINNIDTAEDPSIRDGANVLNVNGNGNEKGTIITGVADGQLPTDAVNVRQLNQVASQVANLDRKVEKYHRNANAGTATAIAIASLPQAADAGANMVSLAGGSYDGETATAIGISRRSDNGKFIIKANGSYNSRGKVGVGVGVGYQWR